MAKISDIWVKLGLKKEGFDKGMDDAAKKAEGFGGKLSKMKAGAIAVWAVIGAAVKKFAEDFVASTNRIGDAWAVFTSQSKAAWDTFLQSLSSWNFNDFFSRMRQATAEAAEFAKAMDTEFEVGNSIKLQRAAMASELAALRVTMQDATKTFDERIKAGQDYIAKMDPIYEQILAQAKRMEDAHLGKWLAGTGLGDSEQVRDDLRKFLVEIGENTELYDELSALLKAQKIIDKGANAAGSNYAKLNEAYSERGRIIGRIKDVIGQYQTPLLDLFRVYNDMRGDKDTAPLIEAMVRAYEAEAAKDNQTREIQSVINGLIQQATNAKLAKAVQEVKNNLGIGDALADITGSLAEDIQEAFNDIDLILPEIDDTAFQKSLENVSAHVDGFISDWEAEQQRIAELNGMLEDAIVASMSNGIQAITDMMAGLEGVNASQVLGALMQPLADTAIQLGEMLVAQGIGVEAFKKSLQSLEGAEAIAAGAALIAIGSAMRSGIQALASGGGASSTAASYSGGSTSGEVENYEQTLTVYVEGKISGSDIVLAGNKTMNRWGR
jgi:hypothetical protein